MSVFAGVYHSTSDKYDSAILVLEAEQGDQIKGTITNTNPKMNLPTKIVGSIVPWDQDHPRYLFTFTGVATVKNEDQAPEIQYHVLGLAGYAQAKSPDQQLDSLTLIAAYAADSADHQNYADAWGGPVEFVRNS